MLIGIGTIIPGLSSSFLLIFLGVYGTLMGMVKDLNLITIGLLGAGAVAMNV
jgi:putative membrane protein